MTCCLYKEYEDKINIGTAAMAIAKNEVFIESCYLVGRG